MATRSTARALVMMSLWIGALAGCDDEPDLEEDPPLAVPGIEVPDPPALPPGMPPGAMAMPSGEPESFNPPLRVPGHDPLPDPPAMPTMPPGGMPPGGMQPVGTPIPLAPGFQPDPVVQQGMAGGPVQAQTTVPESVQCAGFIGPAPNHVVQLTSAFANFRIVVSSALDTTLVVRGPDGTVRCHDDVDYDGGNHNPLVEGAFAPGAYSIFVGAYDAGQTGPYAIGFTELPQVNAQTLAQAAPPPGQVPPGQAPPGAPMAPQPQ